MTLFVHILAGSLGLASGFVALYAAKGATLHRKAGIVFVFSMLTMSIGGIVLTAGKPWQVVNVPAAVMTSYLVITALTTIRPLNAGQRWLNLGGILVAFGVGLTELGFGFEALASGGNRNGIPAFPFFLFGLVGLLGGIGDVRMMRSGPPRGASRLVRHLWRMSFALFIAAMSFFFGQAKVIPEPIRHPALLALPVLAVLVTMLYWLRRLRVRREPRSVVGVPQAAGGTPI